MSVLNPNSEEEPLECPLCLEYLELDDVNFYPCTCGYQVGLINQITLILEFPQFVREGACFGGSPN